MNEKTCLEVPTGEDDQKRAAERVDKGLRLIRIWVPDLRRPEVLADYQRQARLIAQWDAASDEALAWIESGYDWPA